MSTVDYPLGRLPPKDVSLTLGYNTRPGPEATNGMGRSRGMSGAQFRLKLIDIPVFDTDTARAMRGFLFNMEADSSLVRIRVPDLYGIDGPMALATRSLRATYPDGIPFATDALYETGVGHVWPTLEAVVQVDAGHLAREIYATVESELPGGCIISIDEFCYGIAGSWLDAGVNRLKLSPVLRKPALAGATIALAPVFVGTCVTETPGYEALKYGKTGFHTLEFVEDLTRLVESVD